MNKNPPAILTLIICALVCVGFLLSIFQGIFYAPQYLAAYLTKVDHPIKPTYDNYNRLLKDIVKRDRVDYVAARSSPNMDKALKEFASLSCDEFASDSDRLAYWINAYNLLVIKTISDHFPVPNNSIESLSNELNAHRYTVGGNLMTVKEIRQQKIQALLGGTLKGDYTDGRVLFLIAGGAMGYPVVCDHALTSDSLAKDMDTNTYKFNHVMYNVYYAQDTHTLYLSPFFQWNEQTIDQSFTDPFEFVIYYMNENEKLDPTDIHFKKAYSKKFDWRINDIATKG